MQRDADQLVDATWSRRFWCIQILAFRDHSYLIDFGRDDKPPLATLGWHRWLRTSLSFARPRRRAGD